MPWRSALPALLVGLIACGGPATLEQTAGSGAPEIPNWPLTVKKLGTFASGVVDAGATDSLAWAPSTDRLLVVDEETPAIRVLDISDPLDPKQTEQMDLSEFGAELVNVVTHSDFVAAALITEEGGSVVFFDDSFQHLSTLNVTGSPEMMVISPDGRTIAVALEAWVAAEPEAEPAGAVALVYPGDDVSTIGDADVAVVSLAALDLSLLNLDELGMDEESARAVLEPETLAFTPDGDQLWVCLQEVNALMALDTAEAQILTAWSLGSQDRSLPGWELDFANDGEINLANLPVRTLYQPDAIQTFATASGEVLIVTANEGEVPDDAVTLAEFDGERGGGFMVSPAASQAAGVPVGFGGRSLSLWQTDGSRVFDSARQFEDVIARETPESFNMTSKGGPESMDELSDSTGPTPESVVVGSLDGRTYAMVGLDGTSGVLVYDLSDPSAPEFERYLVNRDLGLPFDDPEAGDIGPDGLLFISADQSPTGVALLAIGYEVSGTVTVYELRHEAEPA